VLTVTRQPERARQLAAESLQPIVVDITSNPAALAKFLGAVGGLSEVDTVLFAVGYDRHSGQSIQEVYVDGLRNVLAALPASVERFLYISSTGVYGNVAGDWVDEATPCQPTRAGGKACLAAEDLLREHPLGRRSVILRLAGIYGPGRIPRSADLLASKPIDAPADGFLNLIHVEDAARIAVAAGEMRELPELFVVSDGQPVVRREYYRELARLLHAPEPQFVAPPTESPAAQRAASDKRINPRKLLDTLCPALLYPSYREGLAAAVLAAERPDVTLQ
jgi:nucleoside-diphosphate-sugar epimerase